jgi:hypothetical protein
LADDVTAGLAGMLSKDAFTSTPSVLSRIENRLATEGIDVRPEIEARILNYFRLHTYDSEQVEAKVDEALMTLRSDSPEQMPLRARETLVLGPFSTRSSASIQGTLNLIKEMILLWELAGTARIVTEPSAQWLRSLLNRINSSSLTLSTEVLRILNNLMEASELTDLSIFHDVLAYNQPPSGWENNSVFAMQYLKLILRRESKNNESFMAYMALRPLMRDKHFNQIPAPLRMELFKHATALEDPPYAKYFYTRLSSADNLAWFDLSTWTLLVAMAVEYGDDPFIRTRYHKFIASGITRKALPLWQLPVLRAVVQRLHDRKLIEEIGTVTGEALLQRSSLGAVF